MFLYVSGNFERFQYFNFETNFLGKEKVFQKTRALLFFGSTKIENASFPYKTTLSEANVERIELGVQNGPITKNRVFASTL